VFHSEPAPRPSEAGNDFVENQQNVVGATHLLQALEVALGRNHDPTRPHHGLDDHRRNRLRALALNHGFDVFGALQ